VLVLSLIWLHLVALPDISAEGVDKGKDPALPPAREAVEPQAEEILTGHPEPEDELGEDSAETAAPTVPASTESLRKDVEVNSHPLRLRCRPEPTVKNKALQDNTLRPSLQELEADVVVESEVPRTLPGVETRHLHGRLGHFHNGSCCRIHPVPVSKDPKEKLNSYKGYGFHSAVSEARSVDRVQHDFRPSRCKSIAYPCTLPTASVIISFHNEHMVTLVRSLHSVLNHAPAELLQEIIVVDDASALDKVRYTVRDFERLQGELEDYCKALPKVKLVRLKRRRGTMGARMQGAWRATGDVLVFLDSHIEATPGWLEPLLAHVKEDRTSLAMPSTFPITADKLDFAPSNSLAPMSFTWTLGQHGFTRPKTYLTADSPIVAGGHIAVDRAFFLHLGGYDTNMSTYGGEDIETGFKTWMCGGSIKHVACSMIGHIFRSGAVWSGQAFPVSNEEVIRNKHRAAEVWMDEYVELFKVVSPLPMGEEVGDLTARRDLRRKLNCRSFSWYIENVATDHRMLDLTKPRWEIALMNVMTGGCIDTMGETKADKKIGVYPCHLQPVRKSTQALVMSPETGLIKVLRVPGFCLARQGKKVVLQNCKAQATADSSTHWRWIPSPELSSVGRVASESSCMVASHQMTPKSPFALAMEACSSSNKQFWTWLA